MRHVLDLKFLIDLVIGALPCNLCLRVRALKKMSVSTASAQRALIPVEVSALVWAAQILHSHAPTKLLYIINITSLVIIKNDSDTFRSWRLWKLAMRQRHEATKWGFWGVRAVHRRASLRITRRMERRTSYRGHASDRHVPFLAALSLSPFTCHQTAINCYFLVCDTF